MDTFFWEPVLRSLGDSGRNPPLHHTSRSRPMHATASYDYDFIQAYLLKVKIY
jgi:hypothetical protein